MENSHEFDPAARKRAGCKAFLAGGKLCNLLFFELLDQIHGNSPSGSAKRRRRAVLLVVRVGRASTTPRPVCHYSEPGLPPADLGVPFARADQRSGRRACVSRSASARRQAATLA